MATPSGRSAFHEAEAAACDSEDDENDQEAISEGDEAEEEGGSTTEEDLEGPDYDQEVPILTECPAGYPHALAGKRIYHRYDDGWYPAVVLRQIVASANSRRNGKFACKFDDSVNEIDHLLLEEDYGKEGHWVVIE